jgi:hypothetical protein
VAVLDRPEDLTSLPETIQSKAGITGLTAGAPYYFRVQSVTKDGLGNWSQIVSLKAK